MLAVKGKWYDNYPVTNFTKQRLELDIVAKFIICIFTYCQYLLFFCHIFCKFVHSIRRIQVPWDCSVKWSWGAPWSSPTPGKVSDFPAHQWLRCASSVRVLQISVTRTHLKLWNYVHIVRFGLQGNEIKLVLKTIPTSIILHVLIIFTVSSCSSSTAKTLTCWEIFSFKNFKSIWRASVPKNKVQSLPDNLYCFPPSYSNSWDNFLHIY